MNTSEVRRHIVATPFGPFAIHMADGRRIPVFARDFIMISPAGRYVDVYQPDESHDILDALFISGVSYDAKPAVADQSSHTQP